MSCIFTFLQAGFDTRFYIIVTVMNQFLCSSSLVMRASVAPVDILMYIRWPLIDLHDPWGSLLFVTPPPPPPPDQV